MSTTTSHSETVSTTPANVRRAWLPRLGAALALVPLGVWTTLHLWNNLYAYVSGPSWESHVSSPRHPLVEIITSTVVLLPLILHSIWGVRRLRMMKPNLGRYPTFQNFKFIMQRFTAVGLIGFLAAHIWLARLAPQVNHGRHETFSDIAAHMRHHPPTLIVYVLGVVATAYHLANGLATSGMTWGFAASPRAAKRMAVISVAFFILLTAMGLGAVYALWDKGVAFAVPVD